MDFWKPVLGEVRCVCFQAWCVWVVLLAFWLYFPPEAWNFNNSVCYLKKKRGFVVFFSQVKLWIHLLYKGRASFIETEEYCRLYYVPSWCVSGHKIFSTTWKLKKGHLVRLYTVHQSMHKWQLVFLSHCLNFFRFYRSFLYWLVHSWSVLYTD